MRGSGAVACLALAACGRIGFTVDPEPVEWTAETSGFSGRVYDIWGASATEVYVVGVTGQIFRSTGAGGWTPMQSGVTTDLYGVHGGFGERYAVGNLIGGGMSAILRGSLDDNWVMESNPFTTALNSVAVIAPDEMYIAGYEGTLGRSRGDGTWAAETSGTIVDLLSLWGAPGHVYVVGYDGTILYSTGDGTWTPQASGTTEHLIATWGNAPDDVYAAGYRGTILHSTGDGVWTRQTNDAQFDLYALWGTGPDDLFGGGFSSNILQSSGDGAWVTRDTGSTVVQLEAFWSSGPEDLYLVGDNATILHGTR